jgi:hypothetical protein
MPVTIHALGIEGIERAADAKFNSIEHCAWIAVNSRTVFDTRVARRLVNNEVIRLVALLSILYLKFYPP